MIEILAVMTALAWWQYLGIGYVFGFLLSIPFNIKLAHALREVDPELQEVYDEMPGAYRFAAVLSTLIWPIEVLTSAWWRELVGLEGDFSGFVDKRRR